jgi:2-oxoglutarate ferredoxin oxidoreductase subunit gamma
LTQSSEENKRRKKLKTEIRIAGLGGQGVVLAGHILGKAAAYDGKNVTQTQSYGAEARGSQAKSEIIISDDQIGYPLVRKCDILIVMNQQALEKNLKDLKPEGTLILDSTNARITRRTKTKIIPIPVTETSEKTFGTKTYANMIVLGVIATTIGITSESSLLKAIDETVTKGTIQINQKALRKGEQLASESDGRFATNKKRS